MTLAHCRGLDDNRARTARGGPFGCLHGVQGTGWPQLMNDSTGTARDETARSAARLAAMWRTGLLDTPPEESFDRLTRLATKALDVPIAIVSILDGDRQFFKSCVGLPEPLASLRQTPVATFLHSGSQRGNHVVKGLAVADLSAPQETKHRRTS